MGIQKAFEKYETGIRSMLREAGEKFAADKFRISFEDFKAGYEAAMGSGAEPFAEVDQMVNGYMLKIVSPNVIGNTPRGTKLYTHPAPTAQDSEIRKWQQQSNKHYLALCELQKENADLVEQLKAQPATGSGAEQRAVQLLARIQRLISNNSEDYKKTPVWNDIEQFLTGVDCPAPTAQDSRAPDVTDPASTFYQKIPEETLGYMESFLRENRSKFWMPVDIRRLENICMHLIREVRDIRKPTAQDSNSCSECGPVDSGTALYCVKCWESVQDSKVPEDFIKRVIYLVNGHEEAVAEGNHGDAKDWMRQLQNLLAEKK